MVAAKEAEATAAREQLARTSLMRTASNSSSAALNAGGAGGTRAQHEQAQRNPAVNRRASAAEASEQLNGSVAALREFVLEHQLQLADPRGATPRIVSAVTPGDRPDSASLPLRGSTAPHVPLVY